MIILDTNVVSELMKPQPAACVDAWIKRQFRDDVFLTSVTLAEIFYGIERMDASKRKTVLTSKIEILLGVEFAGRILSFDEAAARRYGVIVSTRQRMGRPIQVPDAQITSIAATKFFSVATRNVVDFEHCGITVLNPWAE